MPEELKDIKENIMNQINHGKIKMKPKIYFILGSVLTFIGLTFSTIFSMFLIGLIRFSLRNNGGPMSDYRFDQILSNFPWWTLVFAILGLIIGISILKKYDFSYKINPLIMVSGFILAIIIAGFFIDAIGLNDTLHRRGPMQGMMNNYLQKGDGTGPMWKK